MSFPVADWQFWVATAIAATCAWAIVRPMLPSRRARSECPGCPSRSPHADPPVRKATLTIGGVRPK